MTYEIIICEDELVFMTELKKVVEEFFTSVGSKVTIHCCSNGAEFERIAGIEAGREPAADAIGVSLIFMDISLGDSDGMKLIEKYRSCGGKDVPVIFVSSMEDRVLEGYEVNAFAFLYKRNYKDKFARTLNRFIKEYSVSVNITTVNSGNMEVISLSDIYYIEADGRKTLIHLAQRNVSDDRGIRQFINDVSENMFFEVYKCVYVNIKHISRINDDTVSLSNGEKVVMSRRKRKSVMSAVVNYIGSR